MKRRRSGAFRRDDSWTVSFNGNAVFAGVPNKVMAYQSALTPPLPRIRVNASQCPPCLIDQFWPKREGCDEDFDAEQRHGGRRCRGFPGGGPRRWSTGPTGGIHHQHPDGPDRISGE